MNELIKLYSTAKKYFDNKNYKVAKLIILKILAVDPHNTNANELAGYIYANEGLHEEAYKFLKIACQSEKSSPESHYYLGIILLNLKKFNEAIYSIEKALKKEDFFEGHLILGDIFTIQKKLKKGINFYKKALELNRKSCEIFFKIGRNYQDLKNYDEAIKNYDEAIILNKNYTGAILNKAICIKKIGCFDEALVLVKKVLELNDEIPEAHSSMGHTLCELCCYEEALKHFDKAIALNPNYAEAWCNKGHALNELKLYDDSIKHFDKAIALNPSYAEAWSNKGLVLVELKRYEEALTCFERAKKINPNLDWLIGHIVHTQMKLCNWNNFQNLLKELKESINAKKKVITPFAYLALSDDLEQLKNVAEIFTNQKHILTRNIPVFTNSNKNKIRVGYFSSDFREHPVSILTAELFELHDRNMFEVIAFSYGVDDNGPMRKRLKASFDKFIDVRLYSDKEIAKLSRDLKINIAVDLGGYTSGGRSGIFVNRAAPIQISYIGFLGTMSNPEIDYLIADEIIIPLNLSKAYTEKIIYLPSYQVNDRKRKIAEKQFTKKELGLPEDKFIFACFNNNYKFIPDIFTAWMKILKSVDDSILYLYAENELVKINLLDQANKNNINDQRIIFGNKISADKNLMRYQLCDIFLDTFPYNGGATCSDAIWAGLPVITMIGKSFSSRYASSILCSAGLSDLITERIEDYINLAIRLATNSAELSNIKQRLLQNRNNCILFDTPKFTKNLEKAYSEAFEKLNTKASLDHIFISDWHSPDSVDS
jgi:protein O-GlcNAc transferase